MFLLNSHALTSRIARDTLKEAMLTDPDEVDNSIGFMHLALSFLAGYGIYISTATDRLVGRMLDTHAK